MGQVLLRPRTLPWLVDLEKAKEDEAMPIVLEYPYVLEMPYLLYLLDLGRPNRPLVS